MNLAQNFQFIRTLWKFDIFVFWTSPRQPFRHLLSFKIGHIFKILHLIRLKLHILSLYMFYILYVLLLTEIATNSGHIGPKPQLCSVLFCAHVVQSNSAIERVNTPFSKCLPIDLEFKVCILCVQFSPLNIFVCVMSSFYAWVSVQAMFKFGVISCGGPAFYVKIAA